MDWADDVAYAVNDLDDFFRDGRIPLDRLAVDGDERARFLEAEFARLGVSGSAQEDLAEIFDGLANLFPLSRPFRGTRVDGAALRGFTSRLIGDYIGAVSLAEGAAGRITLGVSPIKAAEVALLKGLTFYYVINSPALVSQRTEQRALIHSLFDAFATAASSRRDPSIFPPFFQEALAGASPAESLRVVADLIASMSEAQAVEIHNRLTGQSLGSALDHLL